MSEDRWIKNTESVRKICGVLGFKLIGFDPSWSIVEVRVKIPDGMLQVWANDRLGRYLQIPDDFMAYLALLMGYAWEFENTDKDLVKVKMEFETLAKTLSKFPVVKEMNKKGKKDKRLETINTELRNMRELDVREYKQRADNIQFILDTRKKIREWRNNVN